MSDDYEEAMREKRERLSKKQTERKKALSYHSDEGRKPIQVSSHFDETGRYFVLALYNDGTLWRLSGLYEGKPEWESFVAPPSFGGV